MKRPSQSGSGAMHEQSLCVAKPISLKCSYVGVRPLKVCVVQLRKRMLVEVDGHMKELALRPVLFVLHWLHGLLEVEEE